MDQGKYRVFLSYCSVDSDLADMLEQSIRNSEYKKILQVSRYTRDVLFTDDFTKFMDSVTEHDFVVSIISDAYLKSAPCMYEVSQLMVGNQNLKKFLYIVVSQRDEEFFSQFPEWKTKYANIYSEDGRASYIEYWEQKREHVADLLKTRKEPFMHVELMEDLKRYEHILYYEIGVLMKYLNNHRSLSMLEIGKNGAEILFGRFMPLEDDNKLSDSDSDLEEKLKKSLRDCTKPLILPNSVVKSGYYVDDLPSYLTISGNKLFFKGKWFEKEHCDLGVREEGPDAWGACLTLPLGAWFRRKNGGTLTAWYRTRQEERIWFEFAGNGIEVIEIKEDGTVKWTDYLTYEL